jgi:hypothetical protein
MPIKLNSTGGGSVTLDVPSMSTANTLTLPAKSGNIITSADSGTVSQTMLGAGVAGNGPAFSAWIGGNQTITAATWTKVTANVEVFDTASCYDPSTNYRFQPNVAGYYQVSTTYTAISSGASQLLGFLYMNGGQYRYMGNLRYAATVAESGATSSTLVYMNGSSDFLEFYVYINSGTCYLFSGSSYAYNGWTAVLVRAA